MKQQHVNRIILELRFLFNNDSYVFENLEEGCSVWNFRRRIVHLLFSVILVHVESVEVL